MKFNTKARKILRQILYGINVNDQRFESLPTLCFDFHAEFFINLKF